MNCLLSCREGGLDLKQDNGLHKSVLVDRIVLDWTGVLAA